MSETKKVRQLYSELQGRLSQAPTFSKENYGKTYDSGLWNQLNTIVDLLNELTKNDYNRFKLNPENDENWGPFIKLSEYRSNLNALIMNLHAEYFGDEPSPFGGSPHTVVTQTQSQQVSVVIALELQTLIDKQLYGNKELTDNEKSFLEKVKAELPNIKTITDLIATILKIGGALGLSISAISKVLGL